MSTKPLALLIALGLGTGAPLAAYAAAMPDTPKTPHAAPAADIKSNPFYAPSTLPFQYPDFTHIKESDYIPAFEEGMRVQLAEIDAITANPEAPTFDNTIVALERSGQMLNRASTVFGYLTGSNTTDGLDAIETKMSPRFAAHADAINLNSKLFARVKALYDQRESLGLNPEQKRLLWRYHTDFVRAGAQLDDAGKAKLKAMNAELAELGTKFRQNVQAEVNASAIVVDTKEELDGLSNEEIEGLAKAAQQAIDDAAKGLKEARAALKKSPNDAELKKKVADAEMEVARTAPYQGKYLLTLLNFSNQPAQASLKNRALRKRLNDASLARGSRGNAYDNTAIVSRIAKLRAEKAALLGYPNWATYVLEDETAGNPAAVNKMLAGMAPAAVANAKKEAADLQKVVDAEGGGFHVASWDWSYYTEKVRAERYNFDASQLKPYFEMHNVLENGVFYAANQLYGLTFKKRTDLPVYDPDVMVYEVFDKDGKHLALFVADYYKRPNKNGGAWMSEWVSQSGLFGFQPIVSNNLNIPKPPAGEPTLMTWDEVTTAFHEFGHALHGMFSNVTYPRFAGTNVPRDFVEYPSQVNEMWADWPSVLANYAKHYKTGEPMPKELLDKVLASSKFNQGYATTEYLEASLLDQAWHQLPADQLPDAAGVMAFEKKALHDAGVDYPLVPSRYRTPYFSHIWGGGYSAGYYAYIWSEVLDADSVEWFKQNGGLTRANGDHFRDTLLSRGGSEDAVTLFKSFSGKEPYVEPLLIRRGLAPEPAKAESAADSAAEPKKN